MSRVLKRPMFKMGGSAGTGITSGLDKPRQQYNEAGSVNPLTQYPTDFFPQLGTRQIKQDTPNVTMDTSTFSPGAELLKAFEGRNTRPDINRFLIDFGLNLASASPRGGIISTAAEAAKGPAKNLFEQKAADDAFGRKLQLAATQMDIDKKLKEEFADKKFGRDLELALATAKPETKTAAVKNALAMGLEPGTKAFNDYVTASTIKGAGLNIDFNPDGTIKSISEGNQTDTKTKNAARDLKISTFKMNNAANNLFKNLKNAKTGPVGAFVQALDSTGAQLKMAANSFGFKTTGEDRTFIDTGSGAIDNYIEKNFGSFVKNDAVQLGKIKSASINLAYLMARIDEPGGRFTDRDIALKMEELGIGANPERTIAIMQNAIKLRNDNAAFEYKELTGNPLDFSDMNVFEGGFTPQDTSKKTTKTDSGTSGVPEYIFEGGKVFQIIDGKRVEVKL
jgi:hypothetical protein